MRTTYFVNGERRTFITETMGSKFDLGEVNEPDTKKLTSWQMFVKLFFAAQQGRNTGATMTDCAEAYWLMQVQDTDDEVRSAVGYEGTTSESPEDILIAREEGLEEEEIEPRAVATLATQTPEELVEDLLEIVDDQVFWAMLSLYPQDYFAPAVPVECKVRRPVEVAFTPTLVDLLEAKLDRAVPPRRDIKYDAHALKNASRLRKVGKDKFCTTGKRLQS